MATREELDLMKRQRDRKPAAKTAQERLALAKGGTASLSSAVAATDVQRGTQTKAFER